RDAARLRLYIFTSSTLLFFARPRSQIANHQFGNSGDLSRLAVDFGNLHPANSSPSLPSNNMLDPYLLYGYFDQALLILRPMKAPDQRDLFPGALSMMILQTLKRK